MRRLECVRLLFLLPLGMTLSACVDTPTVTNNTSRETLLWQQATMFAEVTPRVDPNNVYVYDAANVLHAVARNNGTERWNKKEVQPLATSALHVGAGVVLLASDELVAFDVNTGAERWRQTKPAGHVVAMRDNVFTETTGDLDGAVRFLEPATGQQRFRTSVLPIDTITALTRGLTFLQTVVTGNSVVSSFEFTPEFTTMAASRCSMPTPVPGAGLAGSSPQLVEVPTAHGIWRSPTE